MIAAMLLWGCARSIPPNAASTIDKPVQACVAGDEAACAALVADAQAAPSKLQIACDAGDTVACRLIRQRAPLTVEVRPGDADIGGSVVMLPNNPYGNIQSVRSAVPAEHPAQAALVVEDDVTVQIWLAVVASLDLEGVSTVSLALPDGTATFRQATMERIGAQPAMTREQIKAVFLDNIEPLQACYQQALDTRQVDDTPQRIVFRLTVQDGAATQTEITSMSTPLDSFEDCLLGTVSGLAFPAAAAPTDITFPFVFQPR